MPLQNPIHSHKKTLRKLMRSQIEGALASREKSSLLILAQIRAHPVWGTASTVALFAPLPEEPDLLGLLEDHGKRFVLPCVAGETLLWRVVRQRSELRPTAQWKGRLLEPVHGELLAPTALDCLIVPGLAFTRCGMRLGRGGGFYDRALALASPHATTLGVCFSNQLVEELPTEPHDRTVDAVLHA